jgi:hypothetical protein
MFRRHPFLGVLLGLGSVVIWSDILLLARRKNLFVL